MLNRTAIIVRYRELVGGFGFEGGEQLRAAVADVEASAEGLRWGLAASIWKIWHCGRRWC
jgi:hypothetical protein